MGGGGVRRLVVLKLKSIVLKDQECWYGFPIFYQVRKHCCGARKYKWALEMQAETVLLKKKNACGGCSFIIWLLNLVVCVFGNLNAHNYVEKKLVFLRTATPVATWTLSSWRDFWSTCSLHGISTVFVVSVFVILCLVFLLLFWFWCDCSNYAIIYVCLYDLTGCGRVFFA